jgi:hypothetical protein
MRIIDEVVTFLKPSPKRLARPASSRQVHWQNFSDASKYISPVDYGKRVAFRCLDFRFSESYLHILLINTFLPNSIEKVMEKWLRLVLNDF